MSRQEQGYPDIRAKHTNFITEEMQSADLFEDYQLHYITIEDSDINLANSIYNGLNWEQRYLIMAQVKTPTKKVKGLDMRSTDGIKYQRGCINYVLKHLEHFKKAS